MDLQKKKALVEELSDIVKEARAMVLMSFSGLTVEESFQLRKDFAQAKAGYKVIKNTLMARALQDSPVAFLSKYLRGPLALVYTKSDPVTMAKALLAALKNNQKIAVVAGSLGDREIGPKDIEAIASLPPPETIKAMFLSTLLAAPRTFLGLLQASARDFLSVLRAREEALQGKD